MTAASLQGTQLHGSNPQQVWLLWADVLQQSVLYID